MLGKIKFYSATFTALAFFGVFGATFAESEPVCIEIYDPVCVLQNVQCVAPPCDPVKVTLPNACKAKAFGAKILYKGECKTEGRLSSDISEPAYPKFPQRTEPPKNCRAWFDGCNICSRQEPGGDPVCSMRYCAGDRKGEFKCTEYFDEYNERNTSRPEPFRHAPVPMDEPGEITPGFVPRTKDYEIIKADLESYATDALDKKEIINIGGTEYRAYYDGSIFLNIKNGDIFDNNISVKGFISPGTGVFIPFEGQAGVVILLDAEQKSLQTTSIELDKNWMQNSLENKKLWFDLNINSSKYKNGSYFLKFKNDNPSGDPSKDAEFLINIKIKHKEIQKSAKELIKEKFADYKIISYIEEKGEFVLQKSERRKILGIFPVMVNKKIIVDEKTLSIKDIKTPWWTIFAL